MKKGSSSSARHTRKSSRSDSAKNQHGMTLRSAKTDSLNDLCEIIRQRDKRITSLEAQVKRLKAVIAAKDSELEKVLPLVALQREVENTDVATDNTSVEVHEEQNPQDSGDQVNGDVVTTLPVARDSGRMLSVALHRGAENTDVATDNTSFGGCEEQNPQNSGEQFNGDVVTILPVAPDSGRMLFDTDMPTAKTSRRDMCGPEVEHSPGMVRNGTTSLVDISCEADAKELEILPKTAAGDSAIEDAADNSFEIYEDPDTENVIEEQGLPLEPSRSGRMPLGERECEGTISWNPDMDQDADMANQSFEDNPEYAVGKEAAKTNSLPSSPTTKPNILGQKYVGATFGSTAATRTAFGSGLLNISPFAALSSAGYNPTPVTTSPEPVRSEFSSENNNTLQPQQKSNSATVLTGEENEKTMHRTGGSLYETENGQWHEQGIDFNVENDITLQPQQESNSATVFPGEENETTMHCTEGTFYEMENGQCREQGIDFNGENGNTLQPQQESNSVMVLTGEENEKTMHRTRTPYAMENGQRREQCIDVAVTDEEGERNRSGTLANSVMVHTGEENEKTMHRTGGTLYETENGQWHEQGIVNGENDTTLQPQQEPNSVTIRPVTNEEGEGNRSGRRPTLGYNPTTLTPSPEPTRSERKRKMSEMFPHASGKKYAWVFV